MNRSKIKHILSLENFIFFSIGYSLQCFFKNKPDKNPVPQAICIIAHATPVRSRCFKEIFFFSRLKIAVTRRVRMYKVGKIRNRGQKKLKIIEKNRPTTRPTGPSCLKEVIFLCFKVVKYLPLPYLKYCRVRSFSASLGI